MVLTCFSDVWTPSGKTILLNTKSSNIIYEVKCIITDKEGVPPDGQRLRFEGIPLEDAWTLENYNIKKTPPFFYYLNRQEVGSNATSPVESLPVLL